MHIVKFSEAPAYEAPGHLGMAMRRLQGMNAGPSDSVWLGLSVIEPGGGTTSSASDVEKFYVVVEGELEVTANFDGRPQVAVMRPLDSCRIAVGESRQLRNNTAEPVKVLLVMPRRP
jgi:mannose-6-phosphate isomerase-like protein (cupin superfamily)